MRQAGPPSPSIMRRIRRPSSSSRSSLAPLGSSRPRPPAPRRASPFRRPGWTSPPPAHGNRGLRRRLLLGRAGRVPAVEGRDQRGLGLCRRREEDGALRDGRHRHDRPCRSGRDHLRSERRSATASCCRSTSRWRTIRPSSTARVRIPARSTARRSSPRSAEQAKVAKAYIAQLDKARLFKATIVTTIEPDRPFYPAEDYHQDFLTLNPTYPYIVYNDLPKIENLKRLFPDLYRDDRCWRCSRAGRTDHACRRLMGDHSQFPPERSWSAATTPHVRQGVC